MVNLKVETYLPIGSVVLLKGAKQKLMITGFCVGQKQENGKTTVYDYLGCLWPMGIIDTNRNFVFNHEDIDIVLFRGLEDDAEKANKEQLEEIVDSVKSSLEKEEDSNGSGE